MMFVQKNWRVLAVFVFVSLCHWLVASYYCGIDWLANMVGSSFNIQSDVITNNGVGQNEVSLIGAFDWMGFQLVGLLLSFLFSVTTFFMTRNIGPNRRLFPVAFSSWTLLALLISPHTLHYDSSIAIFPAILMVDYCIRDGATFDLKYRVGLTLLYLSVFLSGYAASLGFQPLLITLLILYVASNVILYRDRQLTE